MKSKAAFSTNEWYCSRHGGQIGPGEAGKSKPKCKWCGNELTLETWTMSKGG